MDSTYTTATETNDQEPLTIDKKRSPNKTVERTGFSSPICGVHKIELNYVGGGAWECPTCRSL